MGNNKHSIKKFHIGNCEHFIISAKKYFLYVFSILHCLFNQNCVNCNYCNKHTKLFSLKYKIYLWSSYLLPEIHLSRENLFNFICLGVCCKGPISAFHLSGTQFCPLSIYQRSICLGAHFFRDPFVRGPFFWDTFVPKPCCFIQ